MPLSTRSRPTQNGSLGPIPKISDVEDVDVEVEVEEDVDVDVIVVETRPGDAVLLCSDGLSGLVSDKEINDIVNENFLRRSPELLVELANERGGDDNITVVLFSVHNED